jgi:MarC family membrane protein
MLPTAVLLFFIIDPFGLIPVFSTILARVPIERRRTVLIRELLFALLALVTFLFLGHHLIDALHISEPALTISGALILLLIALPMVFPTIKLSMESEESGEPFIVPLAVPMFAGPSALAMVILLGSGSKSGSWPSWLGSVTIAWLAASVVLLLGDVLIARLGKRAVIALERLVGMLLVAISVEMFLSGLNAFLTMAE